MIRKHALPLICGLAAAIVVIYAIFPLLRGLLNDVDLPSTKDIKGLLGPSGKTFEVEGYVTDEAGNWIDGVFLSVIESTPSFSGMEKGPEKQSYQQNVRYFKCRSDGYAELYLLFTKFGYEGHHLDYIKGGTYHQMHIVLKKEPPSSRPLFP